MLLWSVLFACSSKEGPITYMTVSDDVGEVALTLDVSRPAGPGPHPGVVLLHPGAWESGHLYTAGYDTRMVELADRGYVVASLNYRLTAQTINGDVRWPWPAQIQDAKCAVRWLKANADDLDLDTGRVGAVGYSAGGHLALMLAMADGEPSLESPFCEHGASSSIHVAISRSGPTDLAALFSETTNNGRRIIRALLGVDTAHTPEERRQPYQVASPIQYIDASAPPTLLLQGLEDELIVPEDARRFHDAVIERQRDNTLLEFERTGHQWYNDAKSRADDQELRFLNHHLKDAPLELGCSPWPSCEG